ncbi:MAG TPA: sugar phosphate isomerase/epimerase [Bryobacteraceae bacterium]
MTRRDFGKIAAALPAASAFGAAPNSTVGGVKLGAITYSFHDLKRTPGQDAVDECISNLLYAGCQFCELMFSDVEPARQPREELRKWRIETPTEHFEAVRKKFNDAGITIFAYTVNYNAQYSDEEIANSFRHAKALGTNIIASSTTVTMAKRIAPFAEKAGMNVAFHGHTNVKDPEQFAAPENFAAALAMSPLYRINLDIGHFVAAGFEPVSYIQENHQHITHLHVKDKKKNDGPNMPWGQGDTPYKEVLLLIRKNKYDIAAMTEMAYQVTVPTREEVKKNMDDMRKILS